MQKLDEKLIIKRRIYKVGLFMANGGTPTRIPPTREFLPFPPHSTIELSSSDNFYTYFSDLSTSGTHSMFPSCVISGYRIQSGSSVLGGFLLGYSYKMSLAAQEHQSSYRARRWSQTLSNIGRLPTDKPTLHLSFFPPKSSSCQRGSCIQAVKDPS